MMKCDFCKKEFKTGEEIFRVEEKIYCNEVCWHAHQKFEKIKQKAFYIYARGIAEISYDKDYVNRELLAAWQAAEAFYKFAKQKQEEASDETKL